ncbi:hypothetical protein BJ993_002370 [Nocardioides aromaticivorans]|uniref:SnoaL-like domain-containing protein n=1 Tax=Nocardioides aromaticivorans TaxID=200618 RepID=A0A7Y9ZI36_9ACTN|nr:hypothetical protein [Nocardioides aromaticivorans]NYI45290.1 hypothetical protein [Nocardioides aromaticivorans]QSR24400.1 hypothetical protein CFH99_02030 [Nocardioides aromaticivorans]
MTTTPLLQAWFEIMDSTTPERVLDRITDDFRLSILFSTGDGAAEFEGDRAGLEVYLAQREVSVLTHHILSGAAVDGTEIVLGETRRDGAFEASFNASAQLTEDGAKVRRLLICRSPRVRFTD